ncbi:MAG: sulfotransferase domain-containing protein, partial [Cyanobacteria bacterium P01_E01_bin.42]
MMMPQQYNNAKIYPNFLYIGAAKSGSTWIYKILQEHPEVFVPEAKDTMFFDRYYRKGINWYLSFFQEGTGYKAIGEICHDYFLSGETARRIYEFSPHVKIICCLRDPIERSISDYLYKKCIYLKKNVTFNEYISQDQSIKSSKYYQNLEPFYQLFPNQNILILFFDELKQSPPLFVEKLFKFLEVNSNFVPPFLHKKIITAGEPRNYFLAHLAYKMGLLFREIDWANTVGKVKVNPWFNSLLYKPLKNKKEIVKT